MAIVLLKEKLSLLPEINVERGFRFSVNSVKNYRKALYMALKSIKFKLPLIISMMEESEYEGLRVIVHTMMQMLDNIGAESFVKECIYVETLLLNANGQTEEVEDYLGIYIENLADFVSRLEASIPGVDAIAGMKNLDTEDMSSIIEKRESFVQEVCPNRKIV